jgi:hypothetical protein
MSRLTKSPLERLLEDLKDDDALVKASTLKTVMRALLRQVPIPGKGVKAREEPDGIVFSSSGEGNGFGFRVRVVDGLVVVDPGYWDFAGQPTFPGWGGVMFGISDSPALITVGGSQLWRLYLHAEHDEWGVLSGVPGAVQSGTALTSDLNNTYLLLATGNVVGPSFDEILQMAGGSITTLISFTTTDLGAVSSIARSHLSY